MRPANYLIAIGKAIRTRREALGMSQEDLADVVSLHRTYIGGIERGERNLGIENVVKIARGLQLRVSELAALAEALQGVSKDRDK